MKNKISPPHLSNPFSSNIIGKSENIEYKKKDFISEKLLYVSKKLLTIPFTLPVVIILAVTALVFKAIEFLKHGSQKDLNESNNLKKIMNEGYSIN